VEESPDEESFKFKSQLWILHMEVRSFHTGHFQREHALLSSPWGAPEQLQNIKMKQNIRTAQLQKCKTTEQQVKNRQIVKNNKKIRYPKL
jgi:hypothetical protein